MKVSSNVLSWEPFLELSGMVRKIESGTVNRSACAGITGGQVAFYYSIDCRPL